MDERDEKTFELLRDLDIPERLLRDLGNAPIVDEGRLWLAATYRKELSKREMEVLIRLAHGMTLEMVAQDLTIGYQTAATHSKNMLFKLRAKNRPHAVYLACKAGLID